MTVDIRVGDCLDVLRTLEAESVQTCVTSPPYFGLRDYGVAGQIGLESTPDAYVAKLVAVFAEVRRVLADDGTLWLNLGDSYAGSWGAQSRPNGNDIKSTLGGGSMLSARQIVEHPKTTHTGSLKNTPGCKAKDLIGIPWRVAFALQADGWYLRSDIIWHKPNPMPESVTDRPTKSHEYLFLLSKQERYFYNAEAIKEPVAPSQVGRVREDVIGGTSHVERGQHSAGGTYRTNGKHSSQDPQSAGRRIVENVARARAEGADHDSPFGDTRNRRSVWTVATTPYSGAHFATFPPALIEPCILAGSRLGDTVLDPFGGAGTTGLVADRLGRDSLLIELNPEYAELARNRISDDAPLFVEVTS